MLKQRRILAIALVTALGMGTANAAQVAIGPAQQTNAANFTMLDPDGAVLSGGENAVEMTWDGTVFTSIADYTGPGSASNATLVAGTPFNTFLWVAHDVQIFAPGSYTFDTSLGGGVAETGPQTLTVGANQLGMHLLFDWNDSLNIDISVIFDKGGVFGSGNSFLANPGSACSDGLAIPGASCLWDGGGFGSDAVMDGALVDATQVWGLVSVDGNADGIPGIPMNAGGPFPGFSANFSANLQTVPVPAAVWLFGSGLLGLLAIARRTGAHNERA